MRQVRSTVEQTCETIIILFLFGSFTITLVCYELMWSIMQIARGDVVHNQDKLKYEWKTEVEPQTGNWTHDYNGLLTYAHFLCMDCQVYCLIFNTLHIFNILFIVYTPIYCACTFDMLRHLNNFMHKLFNAEMGGYILCGYKRSVYCGLYYNHNVYTPSTTLQNTINKLFFFEWKR